MDRKVTGHSADFIKRQATKLKKEMGIPHHEALDKAAQNVGFTNWKNFLNSSASPRPSPRPTPQPTRSRPRPLVLPYHPMLSKAAYQRPNAKMPIKAHQEIGRLLKEARVATLFHKKAEKEIDSVRCTLDDWVQREYNRIELPGDVFFDLYYHEEGFQPERSPTPERKIALIKMLQRAKVILDANYHDCQPQRALHKKLDRAIVAIEGWPEPKAEKRHYTTKLLAPGTLVRIKRGNVLAIVIKQDEWNRTLDLYTDKGSASATREEVAVCTDQSGTAEFKPMRLYIPYGKWVCPDGSEVLYNRDYCPLWAKKPDGTVIAVDPDTWVTIKDSSESYFNDGTAPWWGDKSTLSVGMAVLKEWGVHDKRSRLLDLLPQAIKNGNVEMLRKKTHDKKFPVAA